MKGSIEKAGSSRRRAALALALITAAGAAACGDDPAEPSTVELDLVVGTYDPTTLTFDVTGPTFGEYDLLAGLPTQQNPPRLVVARDGTIQLVFEDPSTGQFTISNGTYELTGEGIQISFESAAGPGTLLLPQVLDLTLDMDTGQLRYSADTQATLSRLVTLVPDLAGEPLANPVSGLLTAVFTPR
jgi:hypothetical protein